MQQEKGDNLTEGYMLGLWDFTCISVTQNNLQELKEVTVQIKQKRDSKCIPWKSLRDLILAHPDTKKRVNVFALSIYGLVIFPKTLRHIDDAVLDLFDRVDKRVTPIPAILAETFRPFSAYQRAVEGRFIEHAQLLLA
ncbi:hypothetical protein PVK06_047755 [Gossypium arboreum]|uniref:DUF7745 domain-containing protein n=1 Tax=Gossypium arboreum TaxID=29729 RepID=A0ABR0ME83_GOSAR|nr:hypothetical protein PVK06_047755 [Gossypium arboreum]